MVIDDVINQQQTHLLIPLLLIMIATTVIRTIVRYAYQLLFEQSWTKHALSFYEKICITNCKNWIFDFFNHTRVGILWRV